LLKISERLLTGEIALRHGKRDEAINMFQDAVALEDGLPYSEPPLWPIPIRHYLGAALMAVGRQGEAEGVYRTDLVKNPNNGWALLGLTQSLRAQEKMDEAEEAERQFKAVWGYADVTLLSSRF
jgi:predicted Zn-dependent protease